MQGIIILGHGSKAPAAFETLKTIKEMVAKEISGPVEIASMAMNKPDIPEAIGNLVEKGVTQVVVLPFFLYFGIHMQEDIPALLAKEKEKHPQLEIILAENIGADPRLVNILLDRVREVS